MPSGEYRHSANFPGIGSDTQLSLCFVSFENKRVPNFPPVWDRQGGKYWYTFDFSTCAYMFLCEQMQCGAVCVLVCVCVCVSVCVCECVCAHACLCTLAWLPRYRRRRQRWRRRWRRRRCRRWRRHCHNVLRCAIDSLQRYSGVQPRMVLISPWRPSEVSCIPPGAPLCQGFDSLLFK